MRTELEQYRRASDRMRKLDPYRGIRTASAVRHKACSNCFARMDADTQEREDR